MLTQARTGAWEKVRAVTADELAGLTCAHPFRGLDGAAASGISTCRCCPAIMSPTTRARASCTPRPRHGADDYEIGRKHGLPMTYNVLEDGSFREDLPFFGGALTFDAKGKEGDANRA